MLWLYDRWQRFFIYWRRRGLRCACGAQVFNEAGGVPRCWDCHLKASGSLIADGRVIEAQQ